MAPGLGGVAPRRAGLLDAAECLAVAARTLLAGGVGIFRKSAVVEVREPKFLCLVVHVLLVEDSGVGDEAVIDIAVDSGHVIDAESAVGGSTASKFADIRFSLELLGRAEVVLHILTDVVAADLLAPFLTERGRASAVGKNHDVALVGHETVVPAVAPALAQSTLRSAKEYLDGRIHLCRIELRRIEYPGEHLLPVSGLDPALTRLVGCQLADDASVLIGDPAERSVSLVHGHEFGRELHRTVTCEQGAVNDGERRVEIVPCVVRSDSLDFGVGHLHVADCLKSLDQGIEIDALGVRRPDRAACVVLEISGEVTDSIYVRDGGLSIGGSLRVSQLGDHKANLVGLVSVALHAQPGDLLPVRAPDRISVIAAGHRNLDGLACQDAVDVDLRVC